MMMLRRLVSLALFAVVASSATTSAFAQLAPTGAHYAGRPSDTGFAGAVNSSGGYGASVALDLPPARGGMPVPVQLTYQERGVGAAGLGWDVPLTYIRRDTTIARRRPASAGPADPTNPSSNQGAPSSRNQLFLMLEGQRIDLVPKGTVWVARHDGAQLEVRAQSDGTMTMYDGAGRTYKFSATNPRTGIVLFAGNLLLLTDIAGPGGNDVRLEYTVADHVLPDGTGISIDLAKISYNPSPTTANCYKNQVLLVYNQPEAAPIALSVLGEQPVVRTKTLRSIETYGAPTCGEAAVRLRQHVLSYQPDPDTQLPRLQSARMFGQDGTPEANVAIPLGTYTYGSASHNGALTYEKTQTIPLPAQGSKHAYISRTIAVTGANGDPSTQFATLDDLIDLTGDGRPDWAFLSSDVGGLGVARNVPGANGTMAFSTAVQPVAFATVEGSVSNASRYGEQSSATVFQQVIDVNGDGRLDIVIAERSAWTVIQNTPDPADPSHIIWQTRTFDVDELPIADPFGAGSLRRSFTAHGSSVQECYVWNGSTWNKDDNGFHNGHCPPLPTDDHPPDVPVLDPEVTFIEWELKDINNDGYVDLVYNTSVATVTVTSTADALPLDGPRLGEGSTRRTLRRETVHLVPLEAASGPNRVMALLNVFGTHLGAGVNSNPFSAPVLLRDNTDCGVAAWLAEGNMQRKSCDIIDVNGDGVADRVENTSVYLGTGNLDIGGFFMMSPSMRLPDVIAIQANPRTSECPIGTAGDKVFSSSIGVGLRDLNGDGIPDYIGNGVQFGTGTGFTAAMPVPSTGASLLMSLGTEQCDGKIALTTGGLYDMDGDGRPDEVRINADGTGLDVYQLAGGSRAGTPEAGRLIRIDNGYGASTKITYRSAKEDATTAHQVPFPEIVVDSVTTVNAQGTLLAPMLHAYGSASLIFDSAADAFVFRGYGRTIESQLTNGTEGMATINDTYALPPFDPDAPGAMDPQQRYGRYARAGRPSDSTLLSGTIGSDPWSLLSVDTASDARRIGSTHYDWGARVFEEPSTSATADCVDMVEPYNFGASVVRRAGLHDICAAHGFAFGTSMQSRRNEAGAPASSAFFVATRWDVNSADVDDFGRVLSVTNLNDLARSDDDLCVDISYATPTGANQRVLSAVATQRTRKCSSSTDPPVVYSEGEWRYDGLAAGSVSSGFRTAYMVTRHSDTGAALDTVRQYDATFDASGNPSVVTTTRQQDRATRSVTLTYDAFGIVPIRMLTSATGLPVTDVNLTRNPLTLTLDTKVDENGVEARTLYDGFDRPVRSLVRQVSSSLQGALSTVSYLGFSGGDSLGRRVVNKMFSDPVDPNTLDVAVGRISTTYLDELGRSQRTELPLGSDYPNQTLILGQRVYDRLGRVAFEADPYPSTQGIATAYGTTSFFHTDGTPSCTVRANGQLPSLVTATDELHEIYPTCYQRFFQNNLETLRVQDPSSLLAGSPQADVVRVSYATAIGRIVAQSTFQGTTRIEHATFEHDGLGHRKSMTRYQDPAAAANAVTTSWHYDSLGRMLELDEPDAVPQVNTYSDWGELLQVHRTTMAGGNLDLRKQYDALGRLKHSQEERDGGVDLATVNDYAYDQGVSIAPQVTPTNVMGRLAQATSPTGSISLSYDVYGSVNARVFTDAQGGTYVEKHAMHADSTRASLDLFLPDTGFADEHVDYQYDSAGRGRSINYGFEGGQSQALYASEVRDPWGRVRQAHYGPTSYAASYDDLGRRLLKQVTVSSLLGSRSISFQGLDPVGRERSRTETKVGFGPGGLPSSTTSSTYDVLGRLSSASQISGTTSVFNQQFTYDALGNTLGIVNVGTSGAANKRLSYLSTDRDRICRISQGTDTATDCNVTYDEVGSIVTQATPAGLREFSYLVNGRVRSVASGSTVAEYRYDALGEVQELDVTSGALVELRHDRRYGDLIAWHDGPSSSELWRTIPGFDGAVATRHGNGGSWVWAFGELRGSRFFTDETGAFVQDVDYRPYGEAVSTGASGSPDGSLYSREQWNGGDYLAAFGISQLGARLYDPAIGRFLSRDPLLIALTPATANPYAFAMNDPMNGSDPTGLCPPEQVCSDDPVLIPPIVLPITVQVDAGRALWHAIFGGGGKPAPPPDYSHNFRTWAAIVEPPPEFEGQGPVELLTEYAIDTLTDTLTRAWASAVNGISDHSGASHPGYANVVAEARPGIRSYVSPGVKAGVVLLSLIAGPEGLAEGGGEAAAERGVAEFEVGTYDTLKSRSVVGDGLEIHHVGQAHAMEQIVPGYVRATGPSIVLERAAHAAIPNLRGVVELAPRQVLARDIWNLRNLTGAPNSALLELIDLNKEMYPEAFAR